MKPADCFRFCPACGAAPAESAIRTPNPFACAVCGFIYYFNATIAAAVFLRRADGRMLFVRRAREPGKGLLAPPGGFIDIGERVEDALRREIREEVGLEMASPRFLASFPNVYPYRGVTYPVLDFFFVADAIEPDSARPLDDVEAISWLEPWSEVAPADLAFDSMKAALALVREVCPRGGLGKS